MDYLFLFVLAAFLGFSVGQLEGKTEAQESMHRGETQCQTLPDQKIVCWKVTDKK